MTTFTDAELNTMHFALIRQEYLLMTAHHVADALAALGRKLPPDAALGAYTDAQRVQAELAVCRSAKQKIARALGIDTAPDDLEALAVEQSDERYGRKIDDALTRES